MKEVYPMELILNIYNGNEIVKTYATEDYRVTMGLCEDILSIVNVEELGNIEGMSEDDFLKFLPMLMKVFNQYKPLVKQIFPELTDAEYRTCDPKEVTKIAWQVIMFALGELFNVASKN